MPDPLHTNDPGRKPKGWPGRARWQGLCPITESSLGDGIFDGVRYLEHGGRFGVGSDSNIRISLSEELRTLEYSQRLRDTCRASVATPGKFHGTCSVRWALLLEEPRPPGVQSRSDCRRVITPISGAGRQTPIDLEGREGDEILDAYDICR